MGSPLFINVLFMRRGPFWVAQALEYDLAAQGESIEAARIAFERTFIGQLLLDRQAGRPILSTLPRAPQKFWDVFDQVTRTLQKLEPATRMTTPDAALPPAFMIPTFQNDSHRTR